MGEAVSDSVNTIASLTGFNFRFVTQRAIKDRVIQQAQRMMPHLIFYNHNIKNFSKEQSKSQSFETNPSDEDDFEAYVRISPSPYDLRTYSL
jgi:hypothetical protein